MRARWIGPGSTNRSTTMSEMICDVDNRGLGPSRQRSLSRSKIEYLILRDTS